eukprot:scaffold10121_cov112-Isochrysis_galbana.AAC.11
MRLAVRRSRDGAKGAHIVALEHERCLESAHVLGAGEGVARGGEVACEHAVGVGGALEYLKLPLRLGRERLREDAALGQLGLGVHGQPERCD